MGKFSRSKGTRNEYLVRDKFREVGFQVDRIPASGAAQGFKGDLRIKYDNREIIVEVKSRAKEFTKLYAMLDEVGGLSVDLSGIIITYSPVTAVTLAGSKAWLSLSLRPELNALMRKLLVYRANSDILVVKDDRKPAIYLYWPPSTEAKAANA